MPIVQAAVGGVAENGDKVYGESPIHFLRAEGSLNLKVMHDCLSVYQMHLP